MDKPGLDYAAWFHRSARLDERIPFAMRPISVHAGRGLYSGEFYARDGTLIATMVQEWLFRVTDRGSRLPEEPTAQTSSAPK
jgi:acyl-CoA thioesterase-2